MIRAFSIAAAMICTIATHAAAQTRDFEPVTRDQLANPSPGD
jgi:hypothetical protein